MTVQAGRPADPSMLVDVDALVGAYYDRLPDPAIAARSGWPSARRATAGSSL